MIYGILYPLSKNNPTASQAKNDSQTILTSLQLCNVHYIPCELRFSLAWLLALTKSFARLFSRVVKPRKRETSSRRAWKFLLDQVVSRAQEELTITQCFCISTVLDNLCYFAYFCLIFFLINTF